MSNAGKDATLVPVGTVTLLLADIEGSVRWWEGEPGSAPETFGRYDHLVSTVIESHSGVRPVEQGEGDSFLAAFARPSSAVAAAVDLQRALQELGMRVRMAIHVGEVEVRDGDRYMGHTVHRAARIRDVAAGGQVLVSGAATALLADALPDDLALRDLGDHRLRDLARIERLFQLEAPGLERSFPPLRTLDAHPNNLPSAPTSFVGREHELETLTALVRANRLVTIAGLGGCGKTRLAIQCAAMRSGDVDSGPWFVNLSDLDAEGSPIDALRQAVGAGKSSNAGDPLDRIIDALGPGRSLVVLDNCEHLVEAAADLARKLLLLAPGLRLIATSREPLDVDGEVVWRLGPLAVPEEGADLDTAADVDSVALFVERARLARPTFDLNEATLPAVIAICRRVEGLALAIELAASRVRVLAVQAIAEGMADYFRMLAGSSRTAAPRQQTMLASLEWSHHLLSSVEQALFRRLGVFPGTFDLAAVEDVAAMAPVDRVGVFDAMCGLVDRSLVATLDGVGRYRTLEPVREFARRQLIASGELDDIERRLVRYYRSWRSATPTRSRTVAELASEYPNLLAAMAGSAAIGAVEDVAALATSLDDYWQFTGNSADARRWYEWLYEHREVLDERRRARFLALHVWVLTDEVRNEEAADRADEAIALATGDDDRRLLSIALAARAHVALSTGDRVGAVQYLERAVEVNGQLATAVRAGQVAQLAFYYGGLGQPARGRALLDAHLAEWGDTVAPQTAVIIHTRQASLAGQAGDLPAGRRFADLALRIAREIGSPTAIIDPLQVSSAIHSAAGEWDPAVALLLEARTFATELGSRRVGQADVMLARIALSRGDLEGAQLFRAPPYQGLVLDSARAELEFLEGNLEEASRRIRLAIDGERSRRGRPTGTALCVATAIAVDRHEIGTISDELHVCLDAAVADGAVYEAHELLFAIGWLAAATGAPADAVRILIGTRRSFRDLGYVTTAFEERATERALEVARDGLTTSFDEAAAEGERLQLDELVEFTSRGRGRRGRPRAGWESLTPVEERVATLVAEGLTNPEIAARLLVSRATVKSHLTHIFSKLGISNRTELVRDLVSRRTAT
jgi:predicted ATPase/class 3 adenylate cyclase/DNA-binding CsgD family transcriptional regulator